MDKNTIKMANEQNLEGHGFDERTASEQREIARAGGIASGKVRRYRATIASALRKVLDEREANGRTRRENLASKCVTDLYGDVTPNDLRVLADVLGELKQNVSVETEGMAIVVKADTAGNLAKILTNENGND